MNILLNILITLASLYFSWKELQKAISTRKWFNFLLMVFIPVATLISTKNKDWQVLLKYLVIYSLFT
jgi:type IV secretory pathway TrbL component